ncbi:MAG: hypothetical protein KDE00_14455 [Rhodobacteraceae bacterium]|nr:hypothetical protein [Paracoccaceae bacterium]
MMRPIFLALCLNAATAGAALASEDVSALVRDKGLAGAAEVLRASEDPGDRFALAGVQFLGAVEQAWQARWRYGLTLSNPMMPGMQTELFANPAPEPLPADIVVTLGRALIDGMAASEATLAALPDDAEPSFAVNIADLWFDVNASGARDEGEGFGDLALQALLSPWQVEQVKQDMAANPGTPNPLTATIRFDTADADWLRAYTHLVRGMSEVVLAFDPTEEIGRAQELHAALAAQAGASPAGIPEELRAQIEADIRRARPDATDAEVKAEADETAAALSADGAMRGMKDQAGPWVDLAAIIINTLAHQPDAAGITRARDHLVAVAQYNRRFWEKVAVETDNEAEWIPNDRQTAALGFTLPEGTGVTWLAVLSEGEKVLAGDLLIPYWRFAPGHGVNLGTWIAKPAPVRVVDWIQGTAALPYAGAGEVMTIDSWRRFAMLLEGRAGLFAILLN